jgi:hypothetical protein
MRRSLFNGFKASGNDDRKYKNIIIDREISIWMTVIYKADDCIQTVKCMSFESNKSEGVQGGYNHPL